MGIAQQPGIAAEHLHRTSAMPEQLTVVFTSSANAASIHEPDWLTGLGQRLDALPGLPAAESAEPQARSTGLAPDSEDGFELHPGSGRPVAVGVASVYDSVPPLKLTHGELEHYGVSMSRAVATAQLDDRFVSPAYLEKGFRGVSALGMMAREQRVLVHGETGMPTYGSWAQVNAQRDLARHTNINDARYTRLHLSTPLSAHVRELLCHIPDSPLNGEPRVEVVELTSQTRRFRVHFDAWRDPGFIVRTTLHLDPTKVAGFAAQPITQDAKGAWALSRELRAMANALSAQGAAGLALVVDKHCGEALTGVTQGIVGPAYFTGTVMPDPIADLFDIAPDNLIACFTAFELFRTPRDPSLPAWRDAEDEQLGQLLADGWSAQVDKLWVCTPELRDTLEMFAEKYDTTLKVRVLF